MSTTSRGIAQHQGSFTEQIAELRKLAVEYGLYDADDWLAGIIGECECGCGEALMPRASAVRFKVGHGRRAFAYDVRDCGYETACWVYSHGPYGRIRRDDKMLGAHQYSYERFVGPIPEGLVIDHLCGNPRCVNPAHLEPVTQAENSRRGRGTKLCADDVREIRAVADADREGRQDKRLSNGIVAELAERFNVSKWTIRKVIRRETWRGV